MFRSDDCVVGPARLRLINAKFGRMTYPLNAKTDLPLGRFSPSKKLLHREGDCFCGVNLSF
jgi:hypothetical protein